MKNVGEEIQKKIDNGHKVFKNKNGKLVIEETVEGKSAEAYERFEETVSPVRDFYNRKMFLDLKRAEALKVLSGEKSDFLKRQCIKGETQLGLAKKIIKEFSKYEGIFADAEKILKEELKALKNN